MSDNIKKYAYSKFKPVNLTSFTVDSPWTAPSDGILMLSNRENVNGTCYCYISYEGWPRFGLALTNGTGGLLHTMAVPVMKGITYSIIFSGFTVMEKIFYPFE